MLTHTDLKPENILLVSGEEIPCEEGAPETGTTRGSQLKTHQIKVGTAPIGKGATPAASRVRLSPHSVLVCGWCCSRRSRCSRSDAECPSLPCMARHTPPC